MDPLSFTLLFVGSLVIGGIGYFVGGQVGGRKARESSIRFEAEIEGLSNQVSKLEVDLEAIGVERDDLAQSLTKAQQGLTEARVRGEENEKRLNEKVELLEKAEVQLKESFTALSADALKSNNQSFLELAKATLEKFQEGAKGDLSKRQEAIRNLVKPLEESLGRVGKSIQEMEEKRKEAYGGIREQVHSLLQAQQALQAETGNLVKALRAPQVRGKWGEMQLRRSVELAGMLNHVDFTEQDTVSLEAGSQRPDMLIHMPNGRKVVVDAKAPLAAYLDAIEAKDVDKQVGYLVQHSRQIRDHLKKLGTKQYWEQFDDTPEFVVLFLPGETFFSAALEQDPGLIEYGIDQKVILATPTTLIALLKAVAYGWKQEEIAREARVISEQGQVVYDRLAVLAGHFSKLGINLERSVKAYNDAVRSADTRLLPAARRLKELHAGSEKALDTLEGVQGVPELPRSAELSENKSDEST